jgi:hypothetical protein
MSYKSAILLSGSAIKGKSTFAFCVVLISLIQPLWESMGPSVVSALKSGAISPNFTLFFDY